MSRDDAALFDIAKACQLAGQFKAGMTKTAFLEDPKTQSAVLHQLMVIGEGVKRLSRDLKDSHTEIPWKLISGMRDKLVHEYDDVDFEEVWATIQRDIPQLLSGIGPFLPEK